MIVSPDGGMLVSTLGWVDKGGLLAWETRSGSAPAYVPLSEARYVSVHDGRDGYFSVAHFFDRHDRFELTAHRFDAPGQALATWRIANSRIGFEGDPDLQEHIAPCYTSYLDYCCRAEARLLRLDGHDGLTVRELAWFDDSYDKGYQGLTGCHSIPGSDLLIFGIQRCSQPVIYDPRRERVVRRLELAGQYGNCDMKFRRTADELWSVDYDTLVVVDTRDWAVKASRRLQAVEGGSAQTRLFAGGFCFHDAERLCSVGLPFSNAVVTLDTASLETRGMTPFPFQPLDVAVVDGIVFARDWKTGTPAQKPMGR